MRCAMGASRAAAAASGWRRGRPMRRHSGSGEPPACSTTEGRELRRIHLLRVAEEAHVFQPLLAAAVDAGLRVGWLELQAPPPPPEGLRDALAAGSERAVAVGESWTLAARARKGPARLRELLRQQFLGCTL